MREVRVGHAGVGSRAAVRSLLDSLPTLVAPADTLLAGLPRLLVRSDSPFVRHPTSQRRADALLDGVAGLLHGGQARGGV